MTNILSGVFLCILVALWIALLRYNNYLHEEDDNYGN
jgi:hypothetical protein